MNIKKIFINLMTFFQFMHVAALQESQKAPNFSLYDQTGTLYSLNELAGKKIALCFYPKNNTPGCTAQVCSLRDGWTRLKEAHVTVLGINPGSQKSHKNFAQSNKVLFPLLSDENLCVSKAYDAKWLFLPLPKRITFLINEAGYIEHIIDDVDVKNHAEQILKTWNIN